MKHRIPRAVAAAAAVALGLALAAQASAATASSAAGHGHPAPPSNGFARWAPWNTKLPADVPLAANSQAVVDNILQDKQDNFGSWALNTDTYSAPVFTVDRDTPRTTWTYSNCLNKPELAPVIADSLKNVPTPANLIVSQGTDESVAIYQPSTDTYSGARGRTPRATGRRAGAARSSTTSRTPASSGTRSARPPPACRSARS